MRNFLICLTAVLAFGCAGKRQGVRVADPYESATIDQMVGNYVSGSVFERTVVCLNARRETRLVTSLTNQTVTLVTNVALNYVTNQTITITTNQSSTLATNEVPMTLTVVPPPPADSTETNTPPVAAPVISPSTTNVALTTANNSTLSRAGNQTVTTASSQLQRSRQITLNTNNLSITTADNQNISAETNMVINTITNVTVSSITNVAIVLTNQPVHDYFLYAEFTPPADFTLQSGESLVLLVDGVRYAFTSTTSPSVVVPKRGFNAVLYRVPPQLLVDIANAREVKLRLKGSNAVIERELNGTSRHNFKKFLVKYFQTPSQTASRDAESKQIARQ